MVVNISLETLINDNMSTRKSKTCLESTFRTGPFISAVQIIEKKNRMNLEKFD